MAVFNEIKPNLKSDHVALLKMMNLAERDVRAGNTMSAEEAKEALAARRLKEKNF